MPVGWLRRAHAQRLLAWPEIFKRDARGVRIAETLDSAEARSDAVGAVIRALYDEGVITGWRDESYAVVTEFDAQPLFHIERAAARFFGTTTYAAHANGYCGSGAACEMWLARRSATKPIDPGMLDNLVGVWMAVGPPPPPPPVGGGGGGQPHPNPAPPTPQRSPPRCPRSRDAGGEW